MRFKVEMAFLGIENKVSGKSGKAYFMANFMDMKSQQIYNLYISGDKSQLAEPLMNAKLLSTMPVHLKLSSYQGKPQVDFDGVA